MMFVTIIHTFQNIVNLSLVESVEKRGGEREKGCG